MRHFSPELGLPKHLPQRCCEAAGRVLALPNPNLGYKFLGNRDNLLLRASLEQPVAERFVLGVRGEENLPYIEVIKALN